jgi:hypothetical protein
MAVRRNKIKRQTSGGIGSKRRKEESSETKS